MPFCSFCWNVRPALIRVFRDDPRAQQLLDLAEANGVAMQADDFYDACAECLEDAANVVEVEVEVEVPPPPLLAHHYGVCAVPPRRR